MGKKTFGAIQHAISKQKNKDKTLFRIGMLRLSMRPSRLNSRLSMVKPHPSTISASTASNKPFAEGALNDAHTDLVDVFFWSISGVELYE